jgi:hypothetical protein
VSAYFASKNVCFMRQDIRTFSWNCIACQWYFVFIVAEDELSCMRIPFCCVVTWFVTMESEHETVNVRWRLVDIIESVGGAFRCRVCYIMWAFGHGFHYWFQLGLSLWNVIEPNLKWISFMWKFKTRSIFQLRTWFIEFYTLYTVLWNVVVSSEHVSRIIWSEIGKMKFIGLNRQIIHAARGCARTLTNFYF